MCMGELGDKVDAPLFDDMSGDWGKSSDSKPVLSCASGETSRYTIVYVGSHIFRNLSSLFN